jgi:glucokinase
MRTLLAGDVGGTKTVLCVYRIAGDGSDCPQLSEVHKAVYPSASYADFTDLMTTFLKAAAAPVPAAACLGIAGPIHDQRCNATNLPWIIDARALSVGFGVNDVQLLNDLEAAAYGMLNLPPEAFVELNPHAQPNNGHAAVIAAGTGLGEAILAWDGQRHRVLPTEGGHCDFAPNSAQEDALLRYLRGRFDGHVSNERILAGSGFGNLYDFLRDSGYADANDAVEAEMAHGDRNAVISAHGLAGDDPLCSEAVRMFVRIYGSETGNLALKCLPYGGIYIGGGIGPKIRAALASGEFLHGFIDKGRMANAIRHIPLRLSLEPEAPLLGAAYVALNRISGGGT